MEETEQFDQQGGARIPIIWFRAIQQLVADDVKGCDMQEGSLFVFRKSGCLHSDFIGRIITMKLSVFWFVLLALCPFAEAATNSVTREIRYEDGAVRVEDKVSLSFGIWNSVEGLREIFQQARQGNTNLLKNVQRVLSGEDLEVQKHSVTMEDSVMHLEILSKVIVSSQKSAKLRWLPTCAGYRYRNKSSGEMSEPYFLIHGGDGGHLLWMPELDAPTNLTETVTRSLNANFFQTEVFGERTDVLEFRCVLKTGDKVEVLFEAFPWDSPPSLPNLDLLERIHGVHKMSGNDWRRIFTHFKPAKSGYYVIDKSGFTNQAPFLPPGVTEIPQPTIRPMTPQELENFFSSSNSNKVFPNVRQRMDGIYDERKGYKSAWRADVGGNRRVLIEGVPTESLFDVTELYYSNDESYLYLFLKFQPTVEERFEKLNPDGKLMSIGNIAFLYYDTDANPTTGAQRPAVKPDLVGTDLMIPIQAGTRITEGRATSEVSYQIIEWDASRNDFGATRLTQGSSSSAPLISHGRDGVEMAIPLAELGKAKGDRIVFIFENGMPLSRREVIPIQMD